MWNFQGLRSLSMAGVCPGATVISWNAVREVRGRFQFWPRPKSLPLHRSIFSPMPFFENENRCAGQALACWKPFALKIFQEMRERARKTQVTSSVPERFGDFLYSHKLSDGDSLPIFCRAPVSNPEEEEIILDMEHYFRQTEPQEFVCLGMMKVSQDQELLAFTVDTSGNETYDAYLRCLNTMETISFGAEDYGCGIGSLVLTGKGGEYSIYYTIVDEKFRPYAVYRRTISRDKCSKKLTLSKEMELLYTEDNEAFFVDVNMTKNQRYVLINVNSKKSSEVHVIESDQSDSRPVLLKPRCPNQEYFVEHSKGKFYILTNLSAEEDYSLMSCPDTKPGSLWTPVVEANKDAKVEDMDSFENFCVLYERQRGLPQIRVFPWDNPEDCHFVALPEWAKCSILEPGVNSSYQSSQFRFSLSSPIIPQASFDYDMQSQINQAHTTTLFDEVTKRYCCSQVEVQSDDGTAVPMTLVHKEDLQLNGENPSLLFGYGAYGINLELNFKPEWISLIERGWVLGYAHVRGGGELGKQWHAAGRESNKMATFDDFISCAEYLVSQKYSNPEKMAAYGCSAGGLIIGYIANNRPDLFKALVMRVPFLDIANAMQNSHLPLTIHEYDEWGDPSNPKVLEFLKSYSPYENVTSQEYPWTFISTAINDPRVQISDSLKWKAKIVDLNKTNERRITIYTNSDSGHLGPPNDSDYFKDISFEIAFLYKSLQLNSNL